MTAVSGPDLVVASCLNGIVGAFPAHNARTEDELSSWLSQITRRLEERSSPGACGPVAVNLVVHPSNARLDADLAVLGKHAVKLVITSVGSPSRFIEPLHDAGCEVFADVASLRHAEQAVEAGVDGLILLTAGAGGQPGWLNPFAFVRAVRSGFDGPLVLAGGIGDGVALRAAVLLGCDLGYMGTRFIAASESLASDEYRSALVHATPDDVTLTREVTGLPANFLSGPFGADVDAPGSAVDGFDLATVERDRPHMSAGHSVWGVTCVTSVEEIVHQTRTEFHTFDH